MAVIKQLDPHVADLIAAGEVVERPSSVVKELVENALDAGAGAITIEIKKGGLTYIRVTDNGCGMEPEDGEAAFLRHATSKISRSRDLEAIGTLGFRGEALAAISAVSRIDLLTRRTGATEGRSVNVEAGRVVSSTPAGCPEGTTIIVRDLFFNTPARLKFMKSDRAEGAAITALLINSALSRPGVSFRYLRDGKEEFHTPGDGSAQSVIYTLLGREFAKGLIQVQGKGDDVEVSGFVTTPASCRGNRGQQHFFVNGRYIKSKLLQAALEQAYKNSLFTGKFPGCVLYLTVKLSEVDVNVHPAKTEVKFLWEKQVFDAVYYGVLAALEKSTLMPEITLSGDTKRVLENTPKPLGREDGNSPPALGRDTYKRETDLSPGSLRDGGAVVYQSRFDMPDYKPPAPVPPLYPQGTQLSGDKPPAPEEVPEVIPSPAPLVDEEQVPYRVIGEALNTYILVERGEEILFIDKHAAHERIIFDRMKAREYTAMPQMLITPVTVDIGPQYTGVLLENAELLEEFGFELDRFGEQTIALRQVPGDIDLDDMEGFLSEIAQSLMMGKTPDPGGVQDQVLHTMACKAAIKAGRMSDPSEWHQLARRVLSGEVKYCPHGRPVSLTLSKSQLDKQIRRT